MCGVVGYSGSKNACKLVFEGLERLEYRGYDSAGIVVCSTSKPQLKVFKAAGQLHNLFKKLQDNNQENNFQEFQKNNAVGHTRWATHGPATEINAHPHVDCTKTIAVVHNGIIENYQELKNELEAAGHQFVSQSDTEVIAHLFEQLVADNKTEHEILQALFARLEGAFALVIVSEQFPQTVFFARHKSPLCLGIADHGVFVASDPLAFDETVKELLFIPERHYGVIVDNSFEIFAVDGHKAAVAIEPAHKIVVPQTKGNYEHFMLKEMYEQKQAIIRTIAQLKTESAVAQMLGISEQAIKNLEQIVIVACGTSYHAGLIGAFYLEQIARISVIIELASEFKQKLFLPHKNSISIAISQSGQTADTLEAVAVLKQHNIPVIALTNVGFSSLVRQSTGLLLTQAGPEVAVASTKAFSTQVATLYWLSYQLAAVRSLVTTQEVQKAETDLQTTAELLEHNLNQCKDQILTDLDLYQVFKQYVFLGRHVTYPLAKEAALKLQEISYLFCHAYAAGELKHGPLALVDASMPVILFSHPDGVIYKKLLSNAQEVKARNGFLLVFAPEDQQELIQLADKAFICQSSEPLLYPLVLTGIMQYFCYALAKAQGKSIDKPRNLAKSVTVE